MDGAGAGGAKEDFVKFPRTYHIFDTGAFDAHTNHCSAAQVITAGVSARLCASCDVPRSLTS